MRLARLNTRSATGRELTRAAQFVGVSFVSAASNILYILALSHLTALPFWLISLSSTEFSMLVSFVLNDTFTFRTMARDRAWYVRLSRFQIAAIGGNLLTAAISTLLHSGLEWQPVYAQGVAIVVAFFFNFTVHRFWTFRGNNVVHRAITDVATERMRAVPARPLGVSVIIPVRNEVSTIEPLLQRLKNTLAPLGLPYEVLVVDDRSTDATAKAAAFALQHEGIPGAVHTKKGQVGKSYSLIEGFDQAQYALLAMIDGDLELPPEALADMLRKLEHNEMVVGKRLGYDVGNSRRAKLSDAFNGLVVKRFLGLPYQSQVGIKVFKRGVYDALTLSPGDWSFDLELVAQAHAHGFRIAEEAVPFTKRQAGQTKVHPVDVALDLLTSAARLKLVLLQITWGQRKRALIRRLSPRQYAIARAVSLVGVEWVIPVALILAYLSRMMGPAFFSSSVMVGNPGDTYQYLWFIGWFWQALAHGASPLTTHAFQYPVGLNVMQVTSVPAIGLLFGWLYYVTSMQFVFNLIFIANYLVIFTLGKLILREVGVGRTLASLGGILFCLLPYITAQNLGHMNLTFLGPNFLICYLLVRALRRSQPPGVLAGVGLGLAVVLSFYTSLETFMTLFLLLGVLLVVACLLAPRRTLGYVRALARPRFLAGALVALPFVAIGVLNFMRGQTAVAGDFTHLVIWGSNDLLSFALPFKLFRLHTAATAATVQTFTGGLTEWDGYLSIPFVVLLIVQATRSWNSALTRVLLVVAVVFWVFSLGPYAHVGGVVTAIKLPWDLMLKVPFIKVALPSRLALYTEALGIVVLLRQFDADVRRVRSLGRSALLSRTSLANLAGVALVLLCWLPATPWPALELPQAATILSQDQVIDRYIGTQPTVFLCDTGSACFADIMGMFAASHHYEVVATNIYGSNMVVTPSYKLNEALSAGDNALVQSAPSTYLPSINASRVAYVSTDTRPIPMSEEAALDAYLGPPVYDRDGLVVVWDRGP